MMKRIDFKVFTIAAVCVVFLSFSLSARAQDGSALFKSKCAMCHGPNGEGTKTGSKLAGEDPAQFIQEMNDFKSGKRDNAMMKNLATQLSPADTANLAAYYASLK